MYPQCIAQAVHAAVPDMLHELLGADNLAPMEEQILQEGIFLPGKRQGLSGRLHRVGGGIQHNAPESEKSILLGKPAAQEAPSEAVSLPAASLQMDLSRVKIEPLFEDAVDFDIDVPTMPAGYTISALEDISRELAQIIFTKDDKSVCYRMSKGDQDNSGDYTLYSTKKELKAEDISVEIRGNDAIHVAVWFDDGYAYSIHAPSGLSEEEIINIVKSIL